MTTLKSTLKTVSVSVSLLGLLAASPAFAVAQERQEAQGTGTVSGTGAARGEASVQGTGTVFYRDAEGRLRTRSGTGEAEGRGVAIGRGTVAGTGRAGGTGERVVGEADTVLSAGASPEPAGEIVAGASDADEPVRERPLVRGGARGQGDVAGRGIVRGTGSASGSGIVVSRGTNGEPRIRRGTGEVEGRGVAIGRGQASGEGSSLGRGKAEGEGRRRVREGRDG